MQKSIRFAFYFTNFVHLDHNLQDFSKSIRLLIPKLNNLQKQHIVQLQYKNNLCRIQLLIVHMGITYANITSDPKSMTPIRLSRIYATVHTGCIFLLVTTQVRKRALETLPFQRVGVLLQTTATCCC